MPLIDPLLSVGISLFVLWNVVRNLRKVFNVFIQMVPEAFHLDAFERTVLTHPKVLSIHHTHCWTVDGEVHVLTTHLVLDRSATREEMIAAKSLVRSLLDADVFEHVTVDVELEGELCVIGPAHHSAEAQLAHPH